jgi:hypothetical protein
MKLSEFIHTVMLKPRPLRVAANALLRIMLPSTRGVHGALVYLNPDDPVVSGALTLGVYENEEIAFFERVVERQMIFVDVGANVGFIHSAGNENHVLSQQDRVCRTGSGQRFVS